MIDMSTRYEMNAEQVVSKVMDGEAILINLTNGMYYSMGGAGGLAWTLINANLSLTETCERLSADYEVPYDEVETNVTDLVTELLSENLLIASNDREPNDRSNLPETPVTETYECPKLVKYSDMADLFAIDPPMPKIQKGS